MSSHIKNNYFRLAAIGLFFFSLQTLAMSQLNDYFKYIENGKQERAPEVRQEWQPKSFEEEAYIKYFLALKNKKVETFWELYQDLAKNKKLLKLQHESIKNIIELDFLSESSTVGNFNNFSKIAKTMLKRMSGLPEGEKYDLLYLKWILKNKNIKELCKTERSRWLAQSNLELVTILQGLESCPITRDDFIYRIRMLIFSGFAKKAVSEINDFANINKIKVWEKTYLLAVYFSNVGDPTMAYQTLNPHESEIKESVDYYINFFYISQRAGELAQAEKIIDSILQNKLTSSKKKEFIFQKAFLFYQTKRYVEALKLLNELVKTHTSHRSQSKTKDYDNLTWLRAWCYYLAKDYENARLALIENKKWTTDKARNLYWLAQAEWALDNRSPALSYFRQLAAPVLSGQYFSYYNYLAWLRFETYKKYMDSDILASLRIQLSNIKSGRNQYILPDFLTNPNDLIEVYESYFEDSNAENNEPDDNIIVTVREERKLDEETQGILVATSTELKNEMLWADNLILSGHRDLAKWHLYEVEKTLSKKTYVEPLVEYYVKNKYYNRALSMVDRTTSPLGKKLDMSVDLTLWGSLYPKAYQQQVEKAAKKRDIHPYLLWSIMKAETQFKEDAVSPVGAVGLMQFMPYTSQKVAVMLDEDYKSTDLFEPEIAIKYGAMYLKKLSDELGGQLPLVAAAYNGGPHRVRLWLKNFKERDNSNMEYDAFIEHIPFNETRTYVKRVLNYNLIYQKLYENKLEAKLETKSMNWIIEKIPFKLKEPVVLKEEWPFD